MKTNEKENSAEFTAFRYMVKRDLVIQLRDKWEFIFRVAMLPLILILTYGYILPRIGLLPRNFPNRMFSGMIGMSMLVTGIHGTAIPFTMDFNNLREIEDRLLAPVHINIIALEKMFVGIIESFIGGLIVLPVSLIFMGNAIDISITPEQVLMLIPILILISIASACLGLLVGTIIKPMQIAAMFPGFLMPMVFLGAVFFSWGDLSSTPIIQKIVLVNPLVYANEALRTILTPNITHMPMLYSIAGLIISIFIMGYWGKKRFIKMATGVK